MILSISEHDFVISNSLRNRLLSDSCLTESSFNFFNTNPVDFCRKISANPPFPISTKS